MNESESPSHWTASALPSLLICDRELSTFESALPSFPDVETKAFLLAVLILQHPRNLDPARLLELGRRIFLEYAVDRSKKLPEALENLAVTMILIGMKDDSGIYRICAFRWIVFLVEALETRLEDADFGLMLCNFFVMHVPWLLKSPEHIPEEWRTEEKRILTVIRSCAALHYPDKDFQRWVREFDYYYSAEDRG